MQLADQFRAFGAGMNLKVSVFFSRLRRHSRSLAVNSAG